MRTIFKVKNFGKIKKAEIDISGYTIFVGNNNSGKTMLMELIYGVLKKIPLMDFQLEDFEKNKVIDIDAVQINKVIQVLNEHLNNNKERIIRDIFRFSIPLERISIELTGNPQQYHALICDGHELERFIDSGVLPVLKRERLENWFNKEKISMFLYKTKDNGENTLVAGMLVSGEGAEGTLRLNLSRELIQDVIGIEQRPYSKMLFLPASRMGLVTLYKYYFGFNDDSDGQIEDISDRVKENDNIPIPTRDFLSFLLKYEYSEITAMENRDIISFIERHMIEGKINETGALALYHDEGQGVDIPLSISSSMVNEMDPLIKVLSDGPERRFLFYDEVETSLHPLKQQEMARLLNRLYNKGMKLIVSTHSETMAVRINNLFRIKDMVDERGEEILTELGLDVQREDLVSWRGVHVYQFSNNTRGKTDVEELNFRTKPLLGYAFSLFDNSNDELFKEEKKVLGRI